MALSPGFARGLKHRWRAIMTPELNTTRNHEEDSTTNGLNLTKHGKKTPLLVVISSLLASGGWAFTLPLMAPEWYRDDPAYGSDLVQVQKELTLVTEELGKISAQHHQFLISGPSEVRGAIDGVEGKIDEMLQLVIRMEERSRSHSHKKE